MAHWSFHSILVWTFFISCCNASRFIVVAPNLLRTDMRENIFIQANDFSGNTVIPVTITVKDYRNTLNILFRGSITLDQKNNFHALASMLVPSRHLSREEKTKKFVILTVQFGQHHTENRVILVSFQTGYIFIQTDKPIYKPDEYVKIRAYVSSPSFKASDANSITLDIKNPDGIVIDQKSGTKPQNGIFSREFPLGTMASEGTWTITARFDHRPLNNFNTTFEVKKYVLPAFNVTLTTSKPYLDVDDTELLVEIRARYFYSEPVIGTAYVVYGLKTGQTMLRSRKVKEVGMLGDGGTLKLTVDEIKEACEVKSKRDQSDCSMSSLVGSFVYVKVSVLTESGGDLVEAEKSNIKIVKSPHVLALKDMHKYFKPNLPFHFTIHVTYHDGTPANNIPLKVNLLERELSSIDGTAGVSINMPDQLTPQTIIVTTNQPGVSEQRQAKVEVTVKPYTPMNPSRPNYLYIHTGHSKVDMRELPLELSIKSDRRTEINEITYLIISKGKILDAKRESVRDQQVTTVTIKVTKEMMPSFRFVAFYTLGSEVVADSIKLEVSRTCVNTLSVGPQEDHREYRPGSSLSLKIKGEPQARISLVAVDQAVYQLRKNRFNQRYILDEVESRDMGCSDGSGKNAMGVFTDAGLVFGSNRGVSTEAREDLKCPVNPNYSRRRRSAELLEQQAKIMGEFEEKLLQRCCRDGLRGVAMPYTCEERSMYIMGGPECVKAFVKCCDIYKKKINIDRMDDLELGRGTQTAVGSSSDVSDPDENDALSSLGDEDDEYDTGNIYLRDKFEEAWLWIDQFLPENTDLHGLATVTVTQPVPDSITEWSVLAVSSSKETGFCVSEPWTFIVKQAFFIDLKLPYSVARKEQVEIKAVVYNYLDEETLDVTVELMKTSDMCSVAFKRRHTQKIRVRPRTSHVVSYTIVPLKEGKKPIEVAAYVLNRASDRAVKTLNVVMEGVQKTAFETIRLNPTEHQGRQVERTTKPVLRGVVPNSDPVTKLIFSGNLLSDSIENAIKDDPLASLIRMPWGCVEQNLASMTFPIIAKLFLDRTNSWESVGVQRKVDAEDYISKGYSKQLNYKRSDGSYPPYRGHGPSTWVTAYVVKVFTMAFLVVQDINVNYICEPLNFLLQNKQNSDGSFFESNPVYTKSMVGGVSDSTNTDITAFVTIALAEVKQANIDCRSVSVDTQSAINKAVSYLKRALQNTQRPYTKAITSYALALLKDETSFDPTSSLLEASSDGGTYWSDRDALFRLEATGYALLTLVKMGRLTDAKKPFDYLLRNRNIGGSTQTTMVVLHSLSEYLIEQPVPGQQSLKVNLQIAARKEYLNFNSQTSYQSRSFNVKNDADFEIVASGTGQGTVEVMTYYNQLPEEDAKSCTNFDMQVSILKLQEKPPPGTIKAFELTIRLKALGPVNLLSVVLDIGLPTGFTAETRDLENLLKFEDRYIDHFYFDEKLSERSSLIIHLYRVSNTMTHILSFKLYQQFNVGQLQPSPVTVYEYYKEKAQRCTRQYTPQLDQAELVKMCRYGVCTCAQNDCCEIKEEDEDIAEKERETFACKTLHHVFKVKVLNVTHSYYNKYEVEITNVTKLGIEDGVLDGEQRQFYSHTGCTKCQLQLGSQYLIMGPETDRWTIDPDTNKYVYVLGKDTWVERWPTDCTAFRDKCNSLEVAEGRLHNEGCRAKK